MSCKKWGTYELLFKYTYKSRLLKKWGGNYIYMRQNSLMTSFYLPTLSTVKYSSGYFILYMVFDWVHVYKYTKIKGLDSREITSLPESKKSDEHDMSFQSSLKMKQWKFTTRDEFSHTIYIIDQSFAH